jgi:ankyrin repeat protein
MEQQRLYNLCRNAAMDSESSLSKIQRWLDCNRDNKELLHAAANYQNKNKMMALHVVVWKRPPLLMVKRLINIAPNSVQERDVGGRLPLHHACMWGASLDILDLLVTTFPQSIHVKDNTGRTPSQLLQLFKVVEHMDDDDMLLLHHACCCSSFSSIGEPTLNVALLQLLVDAFPDSITLKDNCGRTPSQILKESGTVKKKDENRMLPLHQQAHHNICLTLNLLKLLHDAYPEGIAQTDRHGMLPFHHACLNRSISIEVLNLFIELYPECLLPT